MPVVDGYVVKKAIEKSVIGGDYLDAQIEAYLRAQVNDLTKTGTRLLNRISI